MRFTTRFGEVVLKSLGFHWLEIPDLGIELHGDDKILAMLAQHLLDGKIDERTVEVLKSISRLDSEIQEKLLKRLFRTEPEELRREVEAVRAEVERYAAFKERGFEYFPASNQLLLDTGILITFNDRGGAEVTWAIGIAANHEKFTRCVSEGKVEKEDAATIDEKDIEAMRKAAQSGLLTRQQRELLATLELIGKFSRAKQERLLKRLALGPLPPSAIENLKRDLDAREREAQRAQLYEKAFREFLNQKHDIPHLHFHMNEKSRELLVHFNSFDYWVVRFAGDTAVLLTIDTSLDYFRVFGRWLVKGVWPRSRYFRMEEEHFEELREEELRMLVYVAERIPEPFRTALQSRLVAVKIARYA